MEEEGKERREWRRVKRGGNGGGEEGMEEEGKERRRWRRVRRGGDGGGG